MGQWISILTAFAAGIWGIINPEAVLRFIFNKRYEIKGKTPTVTEKVFVRIICTLMLFSSVFLMVDAIR